MHIQHTKTNVSKMPFVPVSAYQPAERRMGKMRAAIMGGNSLDQNRAVGMDKAIEQAMIEMFDGEEQPTYHFETH